jgi:transposase InsO family protein
MKSPSSASSSPSFPRLVEGEDIEDFLFKFESLAAVHGLPEEKRKATFLSLLPSHTFTLLKNLVFPKDLTDVTYTTLTTTLRGHLKPKPLVIPSRHTLFQRRQRENESIGDYLIALSELAVPCAYPAEVLDVILKDIFVAGLRSRSILDQLFIMDDKCTLQDVYSKAVAIEKAESSANELLSKAVVVHQLEPVNAVSRQIRRPKPGSKPLICLACGKEGHKYADCRVRSKLKCNYCKKPNHIEKVCLQKKNIHHIHNVSHVPPWHVTLMVNNTKVNFELDSGSGATIIPKTTYDKLQMPATLMATTESFITYGGAHTFTPLGVATVQVTRNNTVTELPLYVIDGSVTPILGRQWLSELQLFNHIHHMEQTTGQQGSSLQEEFPHVFQSGIGRAPDTVTLHFKPDATPVFKKARQIPYALKTRVEDELRSMIEEGILKPVEHSEWATPIVPVIQDQGRKVRICADYSCTVNTQLQVPSYPLPRFDELLAKVQGGKIFARLDIRKAFFTLPIDEESGKTLTLNTHLGLLQPQRLLFGVASAPVLWTKFIERVTKGIPGLAVFFDDLLLAGTTHQELHGRLRQLLHTLQDNGLRLNIDKCQFFVPKVQYLGHIISADGIQPSDAGTQAIVELPEPRTPAELKHFLGMITFYARFIPQVGTLAAPLYNLTRKNVRFHWNARCKQSFQKLKTELTSCRVLVPYQPSLPLILATDSSPWALGGVLSHQFPDGSERPIIYIHKRLTPTQERYSQIDKEALAIKWAVEKLHHFLIGREFTLLTDHMPLVHIFNSHRKKLPTLCASRLLHYALFLQNYQFNIKYRSTEEHGNADFLSRLPKHSKHLTLDDTPDDEDVAGLIQINHLQVLPMSVTSLAAETLKDSEGRDLIRKLRTGESLGRTQDSLYTLQSGCVMRGLRTFIPKSWRARVLAELHSGHLGIVKMKSLARTYVYWPQIDKDIENLCKNCTSCALHKGHPPPVHTHHWEEPSGPWERIHMDFAEYGKNIYLIIVDAYSKWPEINITRDMTSHTVIRILKELFARYGLPRVIVTDNQTTFTGRHFQDFVHQLNINHKTIAPYHAATNGQAERLVGAVKLCLRTLHHSGGGSDADKLNTFLAAYRRAPHSSTHVSPSMRFLQREPRTPLSVLEDTPTTSVQGSSTPVQFREGEKVAVRSYSNPLHKWKIGSVVAKDGALHYTVLVEGDLHRRHITQLKKVGPDVQLSPKTYIPPVIIQGSRDDEAVTNTPNAVLPTTTTTETEIEPQPEPDATALQPLPQPSTPLATRRGRRHIQPPQRLDL